MSEVLPSIQRAFAEAVESTQAFIARVPGSTSVKIVVVGVVAGGVVYLCLKKRPKLPPGPVALPLLGNILALSGQKEPLYKILNRWAEEQYGPIIMLHLGPLRCITLNRLDVIHEALVQKGADFAGRPQLCSIGVQTQGFKDITFADDSPAWKLHRKIATKALHHYMQGQQLDRVVHHVVGIVTDRMAQERHAFDPHPYMSMLMFHVLDTLCFGQKKEYDNPSLQRLSETFDALTQEVGNGLLEDALPFLRHFPTQKFRRFSDHVGRLLDYINIQIEKHRDTFCSQNLRDIVDHILLAQKEAVEEEGSEVMPMFTNTHVAQTISDIFGGGVDTSRQTLDWALLFMAGHPEEQALVQAEIDQVTGPCFPVVADLPQLVYTAATLYEIMRLGSVVPLGIPHKTLYDTSAGGYDIPKNTMVLVNLWALLHNSKYWKAPEAFRPYRFIDESTGKLKTDLDSWLPFSTGKRACLGEAVAKPELLLVFACILKRFRVTLPEDASFDPTPQTESMIVHVPKPFKIVVRERHTW